jgi:hypothetical protein
MTTATSEVTIPAGAAALAGTMALPPGAPGVVAFAHGSGSRGFSPRNRDAAARMPAGTATGIVIVPGATHLFEEPGTMDAVIAHASRWFRRWLVPRDA